MDGTKTSKVQKDVNLQRIRDRTQRWHPDVLTDSSADFTQDVAATEQPHSKLNGEGSDTRTRAKGSLPDKVFIPRRSVLSELLEIPHIRRIYHIFIAILIVTLVYDSLQHGELVSDFKIILLSFGNLPMLIALCVCMSLSTSLVFYPLFHYWAYNRPPGKPGWQDWVWFFLYCVYQTLFMMLPVRALYTLPPPFTLFTACEQVRLLMKSHAFLHENTNRVINFGKVKPGEGGPPLPCPEFSKFLYFLFAPTLVYKDHYPRTAKIRWRHVVSNCTQLWACLFYTYYVFAHFCKPVFSNFPEQHVTPRALFVSVCVCTVPATLQLLLLFFAFLHSWMNGFAELLRFADRLFYKDWWNSSSLSRYHRTWNVVVYDWLYSYVYKDIYNFGGIHNRQVAMALVFLLSAVVHEYILTISLGFFYPVLFFLFTGTAFGFIFLPNNGGQQSGNNKGAPWIGNVLMWAALFIGNGLLMCLYSMEWYARQNCKPTSETWLIDQLYPRSWSCEHKETLL